MRGPRRLQVRARQREMGLRRRRCLVDRVLGDLGAGLQLADAGARQLHRPHAGNRSLGLCTDNWLLRPKARRQAGFDAPHRPEAELTARCRCCSPTGTARARRACAFPTTANTIVGGAEQLWHVDPGKPPRSIRRSEGWKPLQDLGHGHRQRRRQRRRLSRLFPDQHGRQQTADADQSRRIRHSPTITTSPSSAAHRAASLRRRRRAALDRLARPVRGREQRRPLDLFIAKGNVAKMPDFAQNDPNNLLLQETDGKFTESATRPASPACKAAAAPRWPTSTSTACSTSWW